MLTLFIIHFCQVGVFFGGLAIAKDEQVLKNNCPHIVVGTPGRILALVKSKKLGLKNLKHFVLDECDKMLEQLGTSECKLSVCLIFLCSRYEEGCSRNFPGHAAREASDDVQRDALQRHPAGLQEVYARRKQSTSRRTGLSFPPAPLAHSLTHSLHSSPRTSQANWSQC